MDGISNHRSTGSTVVDIVSEHICRSLEGVEKTLDFPLEDKTMSGKLKESISTPSLLHFFATSGTASSSDKNSGEASMPDDKGDDRHSKVEPQETLNLLTPLMDAVNKADWSKVLLFLERDPSLARRQVSMVVQGENSKCLLVHYLCGLKCTPVSVIDALVTLHPSSLLQKEERAGRLPIHIAVVKNAFPELVRYLCHARPQALQCRDQEGNLPLHYAAMLGSPPVLRYLLEAYPQGCSEANTRDRFPIHLVCARCYDSSPLPTVDLEAIVKAHPSALLCVDRFGRTPMHLAAGVQHPQWNVLELLTTHAPEALLKKDKARKTPLACARRSQQGNKTCDIIVSSLVEATNHERRRRRQGSPWIGFPYLLSPARSKREIDRGDNEQEKDLYCCYG